METVVIIATAGVTILWSVRSYFLVGYRLEMPDESASRVITIVAPSVYFLLLVGAGLQTEVAVRLDLIGMVLLDVITLLALLVSLFAGVVRAGRKKVFGVFLLVLYHLLAMACVAGVFIIRSSPVLLLSVKSYLRRLNEIELFSFQWVGLDVESQSQDLVSLLNRLLIAVLSYVPIAMLRFLTGIRQRRRMEKTIDQLSRRVEALERASHHSDL